MVKRSLSFETASLRKALQTYFRTDHLGMNVGRYKYGSYLFYDYDGEPIYVGQTKEGISTRIMRHLTNQRTDAVAMSVLDPFEVAEIEVWTLPQFQNLPSAKNATSAEKAQIKAAASHLNQLELAVYNKAIVDSEFSAILNEKPPYAVGGPVILPNSCRGDIISNEVRKLREHPDVRIARRALIVSRLSQVISERQVQDGLRKTLLTQVRRLEWLTEQQLKP